MFTATEAVPVAIVVAGNKRIPASLRWITLTSRSIKEKFGAVRQKRRGQIDPHSNAYRQERPDSGDIWIGETRLEGDEAR